MKPARSPLFQSAAERSDLAAISVWGSPSGTRGAEHPTTSTTTHHVPRTTHLLLLGRQNVPRTKAGATRGAQNVPRERLLEMAAAIRQALPRCVVDVC